MSFRFSFCGRAARPLWALVALLAFVQTSLLAATKTWTGNAADVKQIMTLVPGGTWAAGETATLTINGKSVVVTINANNTTANVATALKEAWAASSRLDGTGSTDATSTAGGQEYGEFTEAAAGVSSSTVTLTAIKAGKPITLSVSETAAAGTLTLATTQTATGSKFWNNANNWDTGTVPANDDTVVFRGNNRSCLYGLPNESLEVTVITYPDYFGQIGLAAVNIDNPSLPYQEYRQLNVRLDDSGTGTNIKHRFGLGGGTGGSPLVNIRHRGVKCTPVVYTTGSPTIVGGKALNICCTDNTSTINIISGSVDFGAQNGFSSAFVGVSQSGGDSRGIDAIHTFSAQVAMSGGTMLIGGSGGISQIIASGGALRIENQSGTIGTLTVQGGTVDYATSNTVTTTNLQSGTLDLRANAGTVTFTTLDFYGGNFLDPFRRRNVTTFNLHFDPSASVQLGATSSTPVTVQ
jgi:hypothetical protein